MTSSDAPSEPRHRHKLLYGRRKGPKLSARQAGLLQDLLPRIVLSPEAGRDARHYFAPLRVADVWLEIGFGGGEHLLFQAEHNPGTGLIGAEPYEGGLAKLLAKLALRDLPNIRLYQGDAREIIAALPDASLGRVFVLFPDPWPKNRHHKRRFISMDTLDRLARVMRPGAELRFATDDRGYLVWAIERLSAHCAFRWMAEAPHDWRQRPSDWPQTRYEAKAMLARRSCGYLRFARI